MELVKYIKGEPGFTIEEAYEQWKKTRQTTEKSKPARLPIERAISEGSRLAKILGKIKVEDLLEERREELRQALFEVQKRIRALLIHLKGSQKHD